MIRHRHIDRICAAAILLALVLTGLLCFGEALGLRPASAAPEYASRLFDDSRVHTVDLRVEDWAAFLENAPAEEYIPRSSTGRNFTRWACGPRGTTPSG